VTQGAAEHVSELLMRGICEDQDGQVRACLIQTATINRWAQRAQVEQPKKYGCCSAREVTLAPAARH